jgi:hypothetical protein
MMSAGTLLLTAGAILATAAPGAAARERDYRFHGSISRPVLENCLSRAITMMDLCTGRGNVDDNIRMLKSIGAKFAGRTVYLWGEERSLPAKLERAKEIAAKVHRADPEIILQAGVFEIVTTQVNEAQIPERVFREFGLPVESRNFRYEEMLFKDGRFHNHWSPGASVPDITRIETRMWFYHLATAYIDVGMEAIHFGQVSLIGANDKEWAGWRDLLARVRRYAAQHARRRMVLCDAHTPDGGPIHDGRLLFDFHSFPLRIKEVPGQPQKAVLEKGYLDSLFGRSRGGITPSGWRCDSLPYLVELDNWGSSGKGGEPGMPYWTWGYDEISWFARQPEAYRNEWLRYAWQWVRDTDPNGFLQMPGSRGLADPVGGEWWYYANTRSDASPFGYSQEETIKSIWAADK